MCFCNIYCTWWLENKEEQIHSKKKSGFLNVLKNTKIDNQRGTVKISNKHQGISTKRTIEYSTNHLGFFTRLTWLGALAPLTRATRDQVFMPVHQP